MANEYGLRMQLIKKYLRFICSIKVSPKPVMQQLLNLAKKDVRTTTGENLRNILLMTDCLSIDELKPDTIDKIQHNQILEEDLWRVNIIKEIVNMKYGSLEIPEDWNITELEEILNFACVSSCSSSPSSWFSSGLGSSNLGTVFPATSFLPIQYS